MAEIYRKGPIELRLGRWEQVLADVAECDAVIGDWPYSARTHAGHGSSERWGTTVPKSYDGCQRSEINYAEMTTDDVELAANRWCKASRGWVVVMCDDVLFGTWRACMDANDRKVFQDVPAIISGMTVRQSGDGPSSWAIHMAVSRPASLSRWGTLRGGYTGPREKQIVTGGKPLWLLRAIVRDYTRRGNLIVDPTAGGATTLLAAAMEGRRAIGAECDEKTYLKAVYRLETGYTPDLFGGQQPARAEG